VDVGIREGIAAVVQPGGSQRDFEVIQACNEANPKVAMVFTGQRAFKH
jgi:phosphoribosylaminoimidazolecarboxamide formyltransferase/IMP cyclohydrolase